MSEISTGHHSDAGRYEIRIRGHLNSRCTAIFLYPVVKRQNQALALGFVGSRTLEAATIFFGVAILLTVVTLRQAGTGTDGLVAGQALVAFYEPHLRHRTGLHSGHQCTAARLAALPITPGAADSSSAGLHRSASAGHQRRRHGVRHVGSGVRSHRNPDHPDRRVGVLPWASIWSSKGFKPSPITAGMAASSTRPAYQDAAV